MEEKNGVYLIPCEVNGLKLKFIFDTGASDVSISLTEALFMLKNGYLSEEDLKGTEYYKIANGDIAEGTTINLKEIKIGNKKLINIKASIIHNSTAPLLLGQSALKRLGSIQFDYSNNILIINTKKEKDENNNKYSFVNEMLFNSWISDEPIIYNNCIFKGFTFMKPEELNNKKLMYNKWYSEGIIFEKIEEGNIRVYPSSFDYLITENEITILIKFSAGNLNVDEKLNFSYILKKNELELTLFNIKAKYQLEE